MDEVCRLCRKESGFYYSTNEFRESLPISVLVMVICPVKIQQEDLLPKQICDECLEVVVNAYKLREISIESDYYLRSQVNPTSQLLNVKQESPLNVIIFSDPLDHHHLPGPQHHQHHQNQQKKAIVTPQPPPAKKKQSNDFHVLCHNFERKSKCWQFFGKLVDEDDMDVESEKYYTFCRLCVAQKSLRTKYKASTVSTGVMFSHLKKAHNIRPIDMKNEVSTDPTEEDAMPEEELPAGHQYQVKSVKGPNRTSVGWNYFGVLVDREQELVESEAGYYFCRLCIAQTQSIHKRYKSDNISTGMMLKHLRKKHSIIFPKPDQFKPKPETSTTTTAAKTIATKESAMVFSCTKQNCKNIYKLKISLEIHMALEHDVDDHIEVLHSAYFVDCTNPKTKAMAYKFFGSLCDSSTGDVVDDEKSYCRICVSSGNLDSKYAQSCSITTLLHHLRDNHVAKEKKTRKRFNDINALSASSPKISKFEDD